eukprot:TRINITY_DN4169_c0_g1::TRINITY_DN4169_c0_g1_i1::g.2153::m.2153 TRINITY_DN4169_c0_g1::TRINITY_DN4169_c0_g1_i1::g.2153  ORF type:complete len:326 (-),score=39.16,sp/O74507/YJD4_SCHPO/23.21/7e-07,DUF1295/PF06966.7/3.8e-58,PEMT/PF04191.8/1.8e+03,PEMT/PF04191.8/2e+03,PEMT/PF04191.8/1.1e-05,Steroid_dh/PF02544.11/1.7e+03,Steroid_dh/PF02544.11/0.0023,ICMT/PF04140.9/0.03 TRINITY_DN4169_c0_g1_i1:302-1279(-)
MNSLRKNILNALLIPLVAIPAILWARLLIYQCPDKTAPEQFQWLCQVGGGDPLTIVNIIFFWNVCVLFWIISLIQNSTWLIDPYWTIIPVMIAHFYAEYPTAVFDSLRSRVVLALVWFWAIRLTHSYFRREEWQFGFREDWRFDEIRQKVGGHWWWISFFAAYISQQIFLVGITLPVLAVHQSNQPWGLLDTVATVLCLAGITIAYFADTQLRNFMVENQRRRDSCEAPILVLNSGLWYYSRHPNYFGEQLWWWGLAVFAHSLGHTWMFVGPFVNTLCLLHVGTMVEARMLARGNRAKAYQQYRETTSYQVPFFKFSAPESKKRS